MTLAQTLQKIKETVANEGTEMQKAKLAGMSVGQLDEMTHIGQSMGAESAINMFLGAK